MGLVYKSAAQRATAPVEAAKSPAPCPYPTWSYDAAFDPDSEEFFADAVYEAVVNPIQQAPAPLSPIESASASSSDSGRISPDADADSLDNDSMPPLDVLDDVPGAALRRVQQDVESLTWLARVPTDAHDVPAAPRPAPATVNIQRARSISDAPNPQSYQRYIAHARAGWLNAVAGRGYALVPPPPIRDEPAAPAEPERIDEHRLFYTGEYATERPSTPPRQYEYTATQTPGSGVLRTPSPPPSVTPHAFTYSFARHGRLPSLAGSPTVSRIATTF
ncbi:unnamed protein product [Peniophora sp. CBMAI 1063]|nr:unnamed protein product [Peniophora sp. CBMAI 1063]